MEACLFLLESVNENISPVNIGSHDEVSIRKLTELMSEVVGYMGETGFYK